MGGGLEPVRSGSMSASDEFPLQMSHARDGIVRAVFGPLLPVRTAQEAV